MCRVESNNFSQKTGVEARNEKARWLGLRPPHRAFRQCDKSVLACLGSAPESGLFPVAEKARDCLL